MPPEEPKRMEQLVMRVLAENLISESRAAELLSAPLEDFWRKVAKEHNGLPAPRFPLTCFIAAITIKATMPEKENHV